jgi:hypothetical protein
MYIDATTRAAADLGFSCIVVHIEIPRSLSENSLLQKNRHLKIETG